MGINNLFKPKWKHSNPQVRKNSIKKQQDIDIIIQMAIHDSDNEVRKEANNTLVNLILSNIDHDVGKTILESLTDESSLSILALNSELTSIRKTAIKKINDKNLILLIAKEDKDIDVRITALKKISDKELLTQFIRKEEDHLIRIAAIELLTNQEELLNIALNDDNLEARQLAITKINDFVSFRYSDDTLPVIPTIPCQSLFNFNG